MWKLIAASFVGVAVGVPLGLLLSSFLAWWYLLASLIVGFFGLLVVLTLLPTPEKRAASAAVKETWRFPDDTELVVEGSDTVLVIDHVNHWSTLAGPHTVVTKYSNKDWDEAFDEIAEEPGISTVSITRYVLYRWWGPMQLTETITVMASRARLPRTSRIGRKPTSRWGRYSRQVREQWFQARTGQLRVTEAELRFLTEELRKGKISPG
ncbi:hypothetical protein [Nonomuraea maheshkhaliensis]